MGVIMGSNDRSRIGFGFKVFSGVALWCCAAVPAPAAVTGTVIFTFSNASQQGNTPLAGLVADAQGRLYGTTSMGGSGGGGVVFRLSPPADGQGPWTEEILHAFSGPDGAGPDWSVVLGADGSVYGTTIGGGAIGGGVAFKLANTPGWPLTILHSFDSSSQPCTPSSALVFGSDGLLYGTTDDRGFCHGRRNSSNYRVSPQGDGVAFQVLGGFSKPGQGDGTLGLSSAPKNAFDGFFGVNPYTIGSDGGLTGYGNIYGLRLFPNGGSATATLYSFGASPNDVTYPVSLVLSGTGALHGLAFGCTKSKPPVNGSTVGGVYQLATNAAGTLTESVINYFSADGVGTSPYPVSQCSLVQANAHGTLLGTTDAGLYTNSGGVFRLDPPTSPGGAWRYAPVFSVGTLIGSLPNGPLARVGNNYFLTLQTGGGNANGSVVELQDPAIAASATVPGHR